MATFAESFARGFSQSLPVGSQIQQNLANQAQSRESTDLRKKAFDIQQKQAELQQRKEMLGIATSLRGLAQNGSKTVAKQGIQDILESQKIDPKSSFGNLITKIATSQDMEDQKIFNLFTSMLPKATPDQVRSLADIYNKNPAQGVQMLSQFTKPQTSKIADPTSPTGSRIVSKRESIGQPAPASAPVAEVNINEGISNRGTQKATEAFGSGVGNRANERVTQSFDALRQNQQLDQVKVALSQGADTGFGAETILNIKSLANTLGISNFENLGPQELIRSISNEMALRLRNPESGLGLTGNTSNKDLEFLKGSVVGLGRTEQGNKMMIDVMQRFNKLKVDLAREQLKTIKENNGVVPLDIDEKLMGFVNDYDFLKPNERARIKKLSKDLEPVDVMEIYNQKNPDEPITINDIKETMQAHDLTASELLDRLM